MLSKHIVSTLASILVVVSVTFAVLTVPAHATAHVLSTNAAEAPAMEHARAGVRRVVKLTPRRLRAINREHRRRDLTLVRPCARVYVIYRDGSARPSQEVCRSEQVGASRAKRFDWPWEGFWGDAWEVTKCSASVLLAIVPLAKAYTFVKALGGVKKTAELLVKAGKWSDVRDAAPGLAAEILGIAAIENNCF